jgi:hypothetical protein
MKRPDSLDAATAFFKARGIDVRVEAKAPVRGAERPTPRSPSASNSHWCSLIRSATGELLWPDYGAGMGEEEAVVSAAHRYWVEQRPDLDDVGPAPRRLP